MPPLGNLEILSSWIYVIKLEIFSENCGNANSARENYGLTFLP